MTEGSSVQRRRGLIPEDLLKFRWLDEIAIAPDASRIAYTIRRPQAASNGYSCHLYLHDLATDQARRLSNGDCQISSIAWSRDSQRLAYSHSDASGDSVRVLDLLDGSGDCYPTDGMPLRELDFCADGRTLAGTRWTTMRVAEERGAADGVPAPTIKVIRRLRYKQDGVRLGA